MLLLFSVMALATQTASAAPSVAGPSAETVAHLPDCTAGSFTFDTDGLDGYFSGMQKGGTLLTVRNIGAEPCKLAGLPTLQLKDRHDRVLPIHRVAPIGMHPGPVVLPVGLAVWAGATTPITWIEGPMEDHSTCFDVAYAAITVGGLTSQIRFPAHICGTRGAAGFSQPPLRTDPIL